MLFKNLLLASSLALSAAASSYNSTSAAAAIQQRFHELDLGYKYTTTLIGHVAAKTESVTADDVVSTYNQTAHAEDNNLNMKQPTAAFPDAIQLVLCETFHTLTLNGIELNNAFTDNADLFNKDQRNTLQEAFTKVNDETGSFFIHVAKVALPECLASLKADISGVYKSLSMVVRALDPADTSS
ncbi:uncharacterized protein KD926_000095 [Aspergillus affinis]|uniref:uncharacterized protein n=1 Tax=Aspergillus affinis TaxID=1070780 RepID=UPI0022FE05D1|nr:uncharacterized protein KD926_000095 [Aspergillus affinis]KAI9037679.1 hypothetical protein KD926_000095 [Aspergillus affinis]